MSMLDLKDVLGKVIEGDCLEVMKDFPEHSIDLIVCDLPYGITANPWDVIIDFGQLWTLYKRIIKPNGAIVLTGAGVFTAKLILSNPDWFKYKIVWIKSKSTNFLNARKQPLRRHEDICVFYSEQPVFNPQMIPGEPYNKGWRKDQNTGTYGKYKPSQAISSGARFPFDVLLIDEYGPEDWFYCKTCEHEKERPFHPTQKPVELGRYLIRTFSRPGDIILDNACGCGSFLVAAIRESRRFIGIEKNLGAYHQKLNAVNFVEIARRRIAAEPIPNYLLLG